MSRNVSHTLSHTHTHTHTLGWCLVRTRSCLLNSLKGKCLFSKCAVQKQVHRLACWSWVPRLSPVTEKRRLPTDWEVESCPQALLRDQICIFTCNSYCGGFGVDKLSWDPCLKGSFYRVNRAESGSRGEILWECAFTILLVHGGPSWRGRCVYENHFFFSCFVSKNITKGSFKCRAPCSKKKTPSSMADTVLVLQNLWQPLHTNLSARKRHTEGTQSFVFFLSAVSTVRQTKSTVWIIHVLV